MIRGHGRRVIVATSTRLETPVHTTGAHRAHRRAPHSSAQRPPARYEPYLDGLFTYRVHKALGQPVENTLHDLRWGAYDESGTTDEYVWVFLISGSAPPAHHVGGWAGSDSLRQPGMYFRLGGGTLRGIAKVGEIVWSRVFVENGKLKMDLGRAKVIELPQAETERRWRKPPCNGRSCTPSPMALTATR